MTDIVLYGTHCVNCLQLERLLQQAKIDYRVVDDKQEMLRMGLDKMPVLGIGERLLPYKEAVDTVVSYIKIERKATNEKQ